MISILAELTKQRHQGSGISKKALAAKKSLWQAIFFSLILSLAASAGPEVQASVAKDKLQTMVYSVYAGGINAVQARLSVDIEKASRYKMMLSAKTRGFLAKLAPWRGSFETEGWKTGEMLRPEIHRSTSTWRDETEIKEYVYNKDGEFVDLKITEEGKDKSPDKIEKDLTSNTTDALTATLLVMQGIREKSSCDGSSEVFDGKRRFLLKFRNQGKTTLKASRYNLYGGPALLCEVEIEPKGGEWHSRPRGWLSIQEQGRKKGFLPKIWLANVSEESPAVPVKVMVKTDYGALMAHLTGYEGNGEVKGDLKRSK